MAHSFKNKKYNEIILESLNHALGVSNSDIKNIWLNKQGMTNISFVVELETLKCIVRIPREDTFELINRYNENDIYTLLKNSNYSFCEDIIFFEPKSGLKISKFIEQSRRCNPYDLKDIKRCFEKLHILHGLGLHVDFDFNIFENIQYYESLRGSTISMHSDYHKTKKNIQSLKYYIDMYKSDFVLSHIDAVSDNFMLTDNNAFLIDWEYAAMQDPHIDIAMFCLYNKQTKEQIDTIIDLYFENDVCNYETRIKIYSYISSCALLWSNWCEYKNNLGVKFGEYANMQYSYAKDYYQIVKDMI